MPVGDFLSSARERLRPFYLKHLFFPIFPDRKPPYFNECWKYPHLSLPAGAPRLAQPGRAKPDILFLPMNDWHTRIQRSQHFAKAMAARGHRCFYVNPHLGRQFPSTRRLNDRVRIGFLAENIYEIHIHIHSEPVFHHRPFTADENREIEEALALVARSFHAPETVQMVSFPVWTEAAERLRRRFGFPIVYDCHDRLDGFTRVGRSVLGLEADLIEASDLIVYSSDVLFRDSESSPAASRKPRLLLRNAVEERRLSQVIPIRRGMNPPVIGYAGALDTWFDIEAVELAAAKHPDWRFRLIGRVECEQVRRLARLPNIEFTGEKPYSELPRMMAEMSVALIPFRLNKLTEATDPIKLYEYLGAGLPVISSRLPDLERFAEHVYFYDQPGELGTRIATALREYDDADSRIRTAAVRKETWSARCETLAAEVSKLAGNAKWRPAGLEAQSSQ